MQDQEKDKNTQGGAPTATGAVNTETLGPKDDERASGNSESRSTAEGQDTGGDTSGGTERSRFAAETTGEFAPKADKSRTSSDEEDFDATSGAGGTTAGGGTSSVPT